MLRKYEVFTLFLEILLKIIDGETEIEITKAIKTEMNKE